MSAFCQSPQTPEFSQGYRIRKRRRHFRRRSRIGKAAHADALTKAQRDEMSPSEIIDVMKKGNERFRSGVRQNRNYLNEQKASASGQYPAAALLSCINSRAPQKSLWTSV
jgi:hypothetical protein